MNLNPGWKMIQELISLSMLAPMQTRVQWTLRHLPSERTLLHGQLLETRRLTLEVHIPAYGVQKTLRSQS